MDAKKTLDLSLEKHPAEEHMKALFQEAGIQGSTVQAARDAGMSWAQILGIIAKFGPGAVEAIQAIIAAINSSKPMPPAEAPKDQKALPAPKEGSKAPVQSPDVKGQQVPEGDPKSKGAHPASAGMTTSAHDLEPQKGNAGKK